jgi:hypothetical protein
LFKVSYSYGIIREFGEEKSIFRVQNLLNQPDILWLRKMNGRDLKWKNRRTRIQGIYFYNLHNSSNHPKNCIEKLCNNNLWREKTFYFVFKSVKKFNWKLGNNLEHYFVFKLSTKILWPKWTKKLLNWSEKMRENWNANSRN